MLRDLLAVHKHLRNVRGALKTQDIAHAGLLLNVQHLPVAADHLVSLLVRVLQRQLLHSMRYIHPNDTLNRRTL